MKATGARSHKHQKSNDFEAPTPIVGYVSKRIRRANLWRHRTNPSLCGRHQTASPSTWDTPACRTCRSIGGGTCGTSAGCRSYRASPATPNARSNTKHHRTKPVIAELQPWLTRFRASRRVGRASPSNPRRSERGPSPALGRGGRAARGSAA